MKTSTRRLITTALAALLGSAGLAMAQVGAYGGPHNGPYAGRFAGAQAGPYAGQQAGMPGGRMGMHMAGTHGVGAPARLAQAKSALNITPAQEPVWTAYEDVVKRQFDAGQAVRNAWTAKFPAGSTPTAADITAQREAQFKLQQAHLAERDTARQALVAQLTPEQRLQADRWLATGTGHGRRMGMGMGRFAG